MIEKLRLRVASLCFLDCPGSRRGSSQIRGRATDSDVSGLAWPESPGLGLALRGSGSSKIQARPGHTGSGRLGPGSGLSQGLLLKVWSKSERNFHHLGSTLDTGKVSHLPYAAIKSAIR